jgi:hypothetical protein
VRRPRARDERRAGRLQLLGAARCTGSPGAARPRAGGGRAAGAAAAARLTQNRRVLSLAAAGQRGWPGCACMPFALFPLFGSPTPPRAPTR